jgi:molybdopterin-guanine dinucleotide biosynthesis protein A
MCQVLGLVLAGGRGRRMGGADKALLPLAGRPLLGHVLARLAPQCAAVAISANGDPARFARFGLPVIPDEEPAFSAGPLAGILAGLDYACTREFTCVVSVPTDTPFLPPDLVARLERAREAATAPLAIAASGGRRHFAIGLWSVALRTDLRTALAGSLRRAEDFVVHHRAPSAQWPTSPCDPFFNVNTPGDATAAAALATGGGW